MKERIKWVDAAKFLGIFAIYFGHFGAFGGRGVSFVFQYHVPLFFFLAGCMDNYDKETNYFKYALKKVKTILVPFFAFCLLYLLLLIIQGIDIETIKLMLKQIFLGGVRNNIFAGGVWFLTCLFVMELVFKLLKYLRNRWVICLGSLLLSVVAEFLIVPNPSLEPHMWYNLDSACYYIIYFGLGYALYPYIVKLFEMNSTGKRLAVGLTGLASAAIAVCRLAGIPLFWDALQGIFGLSYVLTLCNVLLLIWFNLVLAKLLENLPMLGKIGQETLYLCGNEEVLKLLLGTLPGLLGIEFQFRTPLTVLLYTAVLLAVCCKLVIPMEKAVVASVKKSFKSEQK